LIGNLKNDIIKLRLEGKTYNEIVKELDCAKSTVSFHCKNENLGGEKKEDEKTIKELREYRKTNSLKDTKSKFGFSKGKIAYYCPNNNVKTFQDPDTRRKNNTIAVQKRRDNLKIMAVEYLGGCCSRCRYNKYIGALEFHHKDPSKKDFSIGEKGYTRSWEKTKTELDKCILLCSNCHREIHNEIRLDKKNC